MLSREPQREDEDEESFYQRDAEFWERVNESNAELAAVRAHIKAWAGRTPSRKDIITQGRRI